MSEPLDAVEMAQAMRDMASLARTFFDELREQGFDKKEALALTQSWVEALQRGGAA